MNEEVKRRKLRLKVTHKKPIAQHTSEVEESCDSKRLGSALGDNGSFESVASRSSLGNVELEKLRAFMLRVSNVSTEYSSLPPSRERNETVLKSQNESDASLEEWSSLPSACRKCVRQKKLHFRTRDFADEFRTDALRFSESLREDDLPTTSRTFVKAVNSRSNRSAGDIRQMKQDSSSAVLKHPEDDRWTCVLSGTQASGDRMRTQLPTTVRRQSAARRAGVGGSVQPSTSRDLRESEAERRTPNWTQTLRDEQTNQNANCPLLNCCPLCETKFSPSMDQMLIDGHIAACVAAVDADVTW